MIVSVLGYVAPDILLHEIIFSRLHRNFSFVFKVRYKMRGKMEPFWSGVGTTCEVFSYRVGFTTNVIPGTTYSYFLWVRAILILSKTMFSVTFNARHYSNPMLRLKKDTAFHIEMGRVYDIAKPFQYLKMLLRSLIGYSIIFCGTRNPFDR